MEIPGRRAGPSSSLPAMKDLLTDASQPALRQAWERRVC
jgi:hypothetical protein